MKDFAIRNLAQRFSLTDLLASKNHTQRFFSFVREIEKIVKEEVPTVPHPIECLRQAMDKCNIQKEIRPYMVAEFSMAWNERLGKPEEKPKGWYNETTEEITQDEEVAFGWAINGATVTKLVKGQPYENNRG